jgi:hypothetical protein
VIPEGLFDYPPRDLEREAPETGVETKAGIATETVIGVVFSLVSPEIARTAGIDVARLDLRFLFLLRRTK